MIASNLLIFDFIYKTADNEIRTRKVCHRRILSPIRIPVPTYPHVRFCKIYSSVCYEDLKES